MYRCGWVEGLSGVEVDGERVEGRKGFLGEVKGMGCVNGEGEKRYIYSTLQASIANCCINLLY